MRKLVFILLIISAILQANSQSLKSIKGSDVPRPVCETSGVVEKSFIPPPSAFILKSTEPKSDFIVEYVSFPDDARAALEYAVSIWENIIESDVPIHVRARWSSSLGPHTLASCGPEAYYANFKDAPFKERYYAVAIAEKIAKEELNGASRFDIEATFSSDINWYYGTDGKTPTNKHDFVSVAMHEMAHGLGFTGFFFVEGNIGAYAYYEFGDATTFDIMVEDFMGNNLIDTSFFENATSKLKSSLESGILYSESPVAKYANSNQRPRLYVPDEFDGGSSVYHLNDFTYPAGNKNSLMTHAIGLGEAIHDPGPITGGIMEDIGWTNLILHHSPVKDKEEVGPLVFNVQFDSYYPMKEGAIYAIYSTDNFETSKDTLVLIPTENENEYSASMTPVTDIDIQYFIEAQDTRNRIRTSPWNAPDEIYNIHFGPDNEKPVIETAEIPYFLLRGEPLKIEANVDDNLGIDTVYVTYAINDVIQPFFGLRNDFETSYSGFFNFDLETLKDGDIITYNIVAIDASDNKNTSIFPSDQPLQFRVEKIYDAVVKYQNDFNQNSADFVLSDFSIYTADNFSDGALHSSHPYESPNTDNKDLNFSTFLKYPIIIQEEGTMSYDEVVLVEPGEFSAVYGDDDFWDYVIVEGSKDFGVTWYPISDGYDSGENATWYSNYLDEVVGQDSKAEGKAEWYVNRQVSLLESGNFAVGDTIIIRFRLYSDPYSRGWGWAIDNLDIQRTVSAQLTTLSPGSVNVYPNPFTDQFEIEVNPKKVLDEIRIELFDVYGKRLFVLNKQNVSSIKESVNMQNYSSGLYLLKVSENGAPVVSKKIIKN